MAQDKESGLPAVAKSVAPMATTAGIDAATGGAATPFNPLISAGVGAIGNAMSPAPQPQEQVIGGSATPNPGKAQNAALTQQMMQQPQANWSQMLGGR